MSLLNISHFNMPFSVDGRFNGTFVVEMINHTNHHSLTIEGKSYCFILKLWMTSIECEEIWTSLWKYNYWFLVFSHHTYMESLTILPNILSLILYAVLLFGFLFTFLRPFSCVQSRCFTKSLSGLCSLFCLYTMHMHTDWKITLHYFESP